MPFTQIDFQYQLNQLYDISFIKYSEFLQLKKLATTVTISTTPDTIIPNNNSLPTLVPELTNTIKILMSNDPYSVNSKLQEKINIQKKIALLEQEKYLYTTIRNNFKNDPVEYENKYAPIAKINNQIKYYQNKINSIIL